MNKEKLKFYLNGEIYAYPEIRPKNLENHTVEYKKGFNAALEFAISKIDQMDEPEKPVIPYFVADWLNWCKEQEWTLFHATNFDSVEYFESHSRPTGLAKWIRDKDNQEVFAAAWLAYPNIEIDKQKHPVLEAFDQKASEYRDYNDTTQRMQEVRKVIEQALEEVSG